MSQPVFECRQVGFVKLVLTMRHSSALRAPLSSHVQVSLVVVHVSLQQHFKHHRQQLFKVIILLSFCSFCHLGLFSILCDTAYVFMWFR